MDEQIKILLAKYVACEASAEERAVVEQWITASLENEAACIEMFELWHKAIATAGTELVDTSQAFNRLLQLQTDLPAVQKPGRLYRMVALTAAAVSAVILFSTWFFQKEKAEPTAVAALQEVTVPIATKKKIVLPDSTSIWLNEATTLKWDNDFNKKNRTVFLEGEAYFDVAPDKKGIPFIVKTTSYTIRDIGTSFNVKSHAADSSFEAVVIEGIVSIKGNFSQDNKITELRLLKNDVVKVRHHQVNQTGNAATAVAGRQVVEITKIKKPEIYIGWKEDMLVFDGDSFPDVIKKMEEKYKVQIAFEADGLSNYQYSGSFNGSTDIKNVLSIIQETTPIEYEIKEGKISIKAKK